MGVMRMTFAIAPNGRIEKMYRKVKPESHAAEILADLPDLSLQLQIENSGLTAVSARLQFLHCQICTVKFVLSNLHFQICTFKTARAPSP